MLADFTRAGYVSLIEAILARGYRIAGFDDAEVEKAHFVLLHDIDFSIDSGLRMAELEAAHGWRTTYFLMVCSPFYNLFSPRTSAAVRRLRDLGHTIGLHVDASLYGETLTALDEGVARECDSLERLVERPVRWLSFHRAGTLSLPFDSPLAGRRNTYESRFFRDMGYCSDSRGAWHHGHPLDHPALHERRALHLLIHPIWWDADVPTLPEDRLEAYVREYTDDLRREIARHCAAYKRNA